MHNADILIVGAGIIGLSIARELNIRNPNLKITVIEKEPSLALHASGRNSGVLHAGFYYTPDSLKAKLTVEGNRLLTEYCLENRIPINRCGKVVVAKNESEVKTIDELKNRGDKNGVTLALIDEKELDELEPNARTTGKALYSPATSTVDPVEVVEHIGRELNGKKNVRLIFNERFLKRKDYSSATTTSGNVSFRYLINSAGLYADKVAHQFGSGMQYSLIPFKGLYMSYKDDSLIRKHIYPVPDLDNPFLGVHLTKTVDGKVKAGPTAIPAFWRENYSGLSNFSFSETAETFSAESRLFLFNSFNFRNIALKEAVKYFKKNFACQASALVKKSSLSGFGGWLKPGIRAQLYDKRENRLEMDFVVEEKENSMHILNAVSPAFTCAFSFSRFIVDRADRCLSGI